MSSPTDFGTLDLKPELLSNLVDLEYLEMTLVQAQSLPPMIDGVDVVARAKTGSGKTAAFGLALLNKLDASAFQTQALVLCPTRELADQVSNEIRRLARSIKNVKILTLVGGAPVRAQKNSLQRSPHIIVATPGRVHKHLRDGNVDLSGLQTLVLDEADRMLDMGFIDELVAILSFAPADRQTLMFSATYPDEVAEMSARVQRNPTTVDVSEDELPPQIAQTWCTVTREKRQFELLRALRAWGGDLNLVFCNTKVECSEVASYLRAENVGAIALHGDLDQVKRTQALVRFSNRSANVLVATDVAARGLDVKDVDVVFNYELPPQAEVYVHRIGRTARAGKQGLAVSLVEERESWRLGQIEEAMPDAVFQQLGIPDAKRDSLQAPMTTIQISGGKKNKLRAGDILGALTADGGIPGAAVGSIDIFDSYAYVAVEKSKASKASQQLASRPIKGRKYRARAIK
jgi:ATP-independent RNA helicase DbpA